MNILQENLELKLKNAALESRLQKIINSDENISYIVTEYGCNSGANNLWTPRNKLFVNYDEAYSYFLMISPSLTDTKKIAEQTINHEYDPNDKSNHFVIIENRIQIAGNYYDDPNCAKKPYGVVISRCGRL